MVSVADELITEFGSRDKGSGIGKIQLMLPPDPITGTGGGIDREIEIRYSIRYFETRELIDDRIIAGDAYIAFVLAESITKDSKFVSDQGVVWNIQNITEPETQGLKIVNKVHIRK